MLSKINQTLWFYNLHFLIVFLKVQMQVSSKILVANIPPNADLNEVLEKIIVEPTRKLESRGFEFFFAPTGKKEKFCGAIHSILGQSGKLKNSFSLF